MERIKFHFLPALANIALLAGMAACGPVGVSTGEPEQPAEPPVYFTEEFDGDPAADTGQGLPGWSHFLTSGDESLMTWGLDAGYLEFDLQGEYLWAYQIYTPHTYRNVRLDVRVEVRSGINNNVSLICRYTEGVGWYEFAIASNAHYTIKVFDQVSGEYETLYLGGTPTYRRGDKPNEYSAICQDDTLALYINGSLMRTVTETKFNFQEGRIGFAAHSLDTLPVVVAYDWLTVSEP